MHKFYYFKIYTLYNTPSIVGISISALTNTGLFKKAKEAKSASKNAEKEQSQTLSEYERELNKYLARELTDDSKS